MRTRHEAKIVEVLGCLWTGTDKDKNHRGQYDLVIFTEKSLLNEGFLIRRKRTPYYLWEDTCKDNAILGNSNYSAEFGRAVNNAQLSQKYHFVAQKEKYRPFIQVVTRDSRLPRNISPREKLT